MGFRMTEKFQTSGVLQRSKVEIKPWKNFEVKYLKNEKRYEIERKSQLKLDRKSCIGFQLTTNF